METTRVQPFDPDDKHIHIAIGYLLYDRDVKQYYSWAETMSLTTGRTGSSKILNLLTAITGKVITPEVMKRSGGKLDTDKLIGRHISIYMAKNMNGRPKVQMYTRISKEKWTEMDLTKYTQPAWVATKLYDETLEVADGTLDAALDVDVDDSLDLSVKVSDIATGDPLEAFEAFDAIKETKPTTDIEIDFDIQ